MTFVSYARNFEDVLLWRALQHVGTGFYVDVGADHPDTGSVTRAFYDRGWRGINIDTGQAATRLRAARPRDLTLHESLTAEPGQVARPYVVHGGLAVAQAGGGGPTLAAVCRAHAPGAIHFLRIRSDLDPQPVLAGADWTVFRPWIVLAGTAAGSPDILAGAGYRPVWFDGASRFYVAAERAAELAGAFGAPVNAQDDFVRAGDDVDAARRIAHAEAQAAGFRERLADTALDLDETQERLEQLVLRFARDTALAGEAERGAGERERAAEREARERERADRAAAEAHNRAVIASLQAERDHLHRHLARMEEEGAVARRLLAATHNSTSWRVTAPIRGMRHAFGRRPHPVAAEGHTGTETSEAAPPAPAPAPARAATRRIAQAPVRAVHQFHSGSAVGDAVTNGMLLTRRLLRGLGYASDIYVQHRPAALERELRLVEELPDHAGYVLLVRHSMGHDALTHVLELPAPKVLLYHNITPPEHLPDPHLRRYAALGREQLKTLRPHVAGALADSAFNALELRELGYGTVQTCPLLFDLDAMRDRIGAARMGADPEGEPFTVLFVGRVIESKAQSELVDAFARFCTLFARPARLVLVGGIGSPAYLESVLAAVRRHRLEDRVLITGAVSDAARDDWYGRTDLYVSLSHHEGFGVPLVEAMARNVPVLAWPAGAVPATLGEGGELLDDPGPTAVARRMLALAQDPARRAVLAERGRRSLDRFQLPRHVDRLQEALLRAGVAPAPDTLARDGLQSGLRYAVTGHANRAYSLASVNRALALAVEAERPGRVRFLPVEGAPSTDLTGVPDRQRRAIGVLASRLAPNSGVEVLVSQHYPVHVPVRRARVQLALFFWEESAIPADTVATLGRSFDAVLSPSRFVTKALIDSGVPVPVRLLGQAPDLSAFQALAERRVRVRPDRPYTFLHVSSCFPRKGVDVLLAAWAATFTAQDQVRLVIKGFPNPHNDAADQIARLPPGCAPVTLVDEELDEAGLLALYEAADAAVLPTRGEGYNLTALEALAAGLPLIVTGFGGHLDFCSPAEARLLDYRFAPSASHLASPASVWVEPSVDDLAAALREFADDPDGAAARVPAGRVRAKGAADRAALARRLDAAALDALLDPPEPPRVAWVSTWNVRCGVAEYSRHMLDNLPREGLDFVVLADDRTPHGDAPRVRSPWRQGTPGTLPNLIAAIRREDAHVVVIQHQPGLMDWPTLRRLLRAVEDDGRLAVVTLHNTRHLLTLDDDLRDEVLQALRDAARVIVHTVADLNRMKDLGAVSNVTLLPHGAMPAHPAYHPRKLDPSTDAPVIGSTGFFLPEKGLPQLVEALGLLRRTWPHARLRLVNAAYDSPLSLDEIARCREVADRSGIADAVEFVTDFLPHERCMELLQGCDLLALPYQSSLEASSAALRTAFASGVAVAVTPLPLFAEDGASALKLPGARPADIAAGLDHMLRDPRGCWRAAEDAHYWMLARAWPSTGQRMAGMLRGLHASRTAAAGT